jgi:hypothetical protein
VKGAAAAGAGPVAAAATLRRRCWCVGPLAALQGCRRQTDRATALLPLTNAAGVAVAAMLSPLEEREAGLGARVTG